MSTDEAHWPAREVELRSLASLVPYEANPRTHPDWQVAQLVESIKQWGFTLPLLIDEGGRLIAGHARLAAARVLNLERVPVTIARGWSEAQKRAYVIADNQLSLSSQWDEHRLMSELAALTSDAFDVGLLGFTDAELARLTETSDGLANDIEREYQGMPNFHQDDQLPYKTMQLHFRNDEDILAFAQLIGQPQLTKHSKFVWFPAEERYKADSKRYVSES